MKLLQTVSFLCSFRPNTNGFLLLQINMADAEHQLACTQLSSHAFDPQIVTLRPACAQSVFFPTLISILPPRYQPDAPLLNDRWPP